MAKKSFDDWMRDVDRAVDNIAGVSVYDLPDKDFMGWFESGMRATQAAHLALKEEGY